MSWCYILTGNQLERSERILAKPRHGEVQINIAAASLNHRDLAIKHGYFPAADRVVPLSDGAGIVTAVGDGVDEFLAGDRVVSCFYPFWESGRTTAFNHRASLGCEMDGMLRESATLSSTAIVHSPAHLSLIEAATLPCAALTAWSALFSSGGLVPGEHVLIQGTGGVAVFALQFAKAAGAEVTVISSAEKKLAQAKALGADHCITYGESREWGAAVNRLHGGEVIDLVIELGGSSTLAQSLSCLKVGGRISVIGVLSGTEASLCISDILRKAVSMKGITVGHRDDFKAMNRFLALHALHPVIHDRVPHDHAPSAYDALAAGGHFGKIVIDCGD